MTVSVQFDLRTRLGPVRDQGARPTCLAQASTTAHEHARGATLALSCEYLHFYASKEGSSSEGVDFTSMARALRDPGQPTESDCPYHQDEPPNGWIPPTNVSLYRRQSALAETEPDTVESLILSGHIPVLGIATTGAFYSPTPPWVISPDGPLMGLHAVVAVGIGTTSTERCFLIRNSWGTAWGNAGHVWLSEAFVNEHLHDVMVLTEEVIGWPS